MGRMPLFHWKDATVSASLLLLALATASPLPAAELQDAQATVDTVVADTHFMIPLAPSKAPIPFENFRYPYVDAQENVLFVGNDRYTFHAKENGGIYRSNAADGRIEALVKQEQPAPDDGLPIGGIMGLQTDFRSLVFHRGPDQGTGIYGIFDGGSLETVANTRTRVPGLNQPFAWFWYPDVSNDQVVFHGTYTLNGTEIYGLYLYRHRDQKLWKLLDSSQTLQVVSGSRLTSLSYQPRIDRSWLIFSANRADGDGKPLPGRGIFGWPLDATANAGIDERSTSLDRLQILAPLGMIIPESGDRPMTSAPNPVVDKGLIAVIAGSDPAQPNSEYPAYQALCVRTPDGIWHNPIDTDTLIPGDNKGATFTKFYKWIAVQDGQVIFQVSGPKNYQAIYLYNAESDTLYFVTDTKRLVEDKHVSRFEVSTHPLTGQRLAMMILFQDSTSGEYLATLPGLPVKVARKPVVASE